MICSPSVKQIHEGLVCSLQDELNLPPNMVSEISESILKNKNALVTISLDKPTIYYLFLQDLPLRLKYTPFPSLEEQVLEQLSGKTFSHPYTPQTEDPKAQEKACPTVPDAPSVASVLPIAYDKDDIERILKSAKESRSFVMDSLRDLKTSFEQVRCAYQKSQTQYNKLVSDLRNTFHNPGLQKLADLYRKMDLDQTHSPETLAYKAELYNTMATFGMQQFSPNYGDSYDSAWHERLDGSTQGEVIRICTHAGWCMDDTIYVRALVKTADTLLPTEEEQQ